jgi:hypothetical protein
VVDPQDLSSLLEERRRDAHVVSDVAGNRRESYQGWAKRVLVTDQIGAGDWHVVWPDHKIDRALPKVPNLQVLASEHRARLVAEVVPSIVVRPEKLQDKAKVAAEKHERILAGYWHQNLVGLKLPRFAMDLMYTGLAAVKVLPDFTKPSAERFPLFTRLDPRHCFPGPVFSEGPIPDDIVIGYQQDLHTIEKRFGVDLGAMSERAKRKGYNNPTDMPRVVEFYDDEFCIAIAEIGSKKSNNHAYETLLVAPHNLGRTPVAIGIRPSFDGIYRGDFDQLHAIINTQNRMMTLHIDSAIQKVYPAHLWYDIENPEDWGPDAMLEKKSREGSFESVGEAAAPYDNYNILKMVADFGRTVAMVPESTTGDPSQSIISAAAVNAVQTMPNTHVVSLQRDSLAPMLQAANELALRADERWGDTEKTIIGVQRGTTFAETYTPSKDIGGNYTNEVVYGDSAGLDKVNANVMNLQNLQARLITRRTAMERSPFVEDPIREEKQMLRESLHDSMLAGIMTASQVPPGTPGAITPEQIAKVDELLEKEGTTLREALLEATARVPMAPPPQAGPLNPASPGLAGAAEPNQPAPFNAPSLADLGVA